MAFKKLTRAQKLTLFKKGHACNGKRRNLYEQLRDDVRPTKGKREKLARHFGITNSSWVAIKQAAKDHPELVKSWDEGHRPKDPSKVALTLRTTAHPYQTNKFDAFCREIYSNVNLSSYVLAHRLDIDEELARTWLAEVKETKRYQEIAMLAEEQFENTLQDLMQETVEDIRLMKKITPEKKLEMISQAMSIYKTLQDGKLKRDALIANREQKAIRSIKDSTLSVKIDLNEVNKGEESEADKEAPDFSHEGDI